MYLDIADLQRFYTSPMGRTTGTLIRRRLKEAWPDLQHHRSVGLGYAPGIMQGVAGTLALMPGQQGIAHWPANHPNRAALTDELSLPLGDGSVDRLALIHMLEHTNDPGRLLREVWRVLAPEGRVMAILPHRRSPWALMERTPFGHGRPYSVGQATKLLRDRLFEPESWRGALYWPPFRRGASERMLRWSEKPGSRLWPALSGVIMIEATKRVEARIDGTATVPALAYARA
ncbi:MAG: methyltransferase domain-containing protein [Alphaproteobacteria bacterium]